MSPVTRLHGEHPGPGLLVVAVDVPPGGATRGLAGGRGEDLQLRRDRAGGHRES